MSIGWIKYKKDNKSFRMPKNLGLNVYDIEDLDDTDKKIDELVKNNFNTIIVSNEVASFSEDIIKKYSKNEEVNIIIAPHKKNINDI